LPRRDIEDSGQSEDFIVAESPLSPAAFAFGCAHGGVGWPAHQRAELRLAPPLTLTQRPDVRAYDGVEPAGDRSGAARL
jgi:hypothetical protein